MPAPSSNGIGDGVDISSLPHIDEAKELELQAVMLADGGQLAEALEVCNRAILLSPQYPSLYNNRAQVGHYGSCYGNGCYGSCYGSCYAHKPGSYIM